MGEPADDEERNTEKKRKILLLAGELHGSGHYESASDAKKAASDGTRPESELKNLLSGLLYGHRRDTRQKRCGEASDYVAEEDEEKGSDLILLNESCSTCVETESVTDHSKESEGEKNRTDKGAIGLRLHSGCKKTEAGSSDGDSGKY